jgi:HPt (histidine-containing phosphotransfer) domain-containing protein
MTNGNKYGKLRKWMRMIHEMLAKFCDETGIDQETGLRLLDSFLYKLPTDLDLIETTLAEADFAKLVRQAHSLKGTSANLRLTEMAGLAASLEKTIRLEQADEARRFLQQIRKSFALLSAERGAWQ